ncbi:radical SAM/SPASM domain-containing protein [Butyrivibrio fibrisolvens]|uniref:Radical SAM core domain-containing protein n=1 Tax=Butyrivibrio fibrisolvens TaxID=831 RepID=A0A1H9X132_BUTFI|nr:radical SAM protein [Butyrivibrio fibrisolvens]SES39840.1 uncharacterized protein SAMN04487884_13913 [Butyrivibrio fibrisolvens]
MRFSSYNILTPKMKSGDHVLLNGLKGTLDLIDEEAYDLIKSHEDDEELSDDVMDIIAEFKDDYIKRGYLTELGSEDEVISARQQALEMTEKIDTNRWTIVLVPNLGCNYRCTYCFEKNEGYPERTMTKEQVDSVFEIIKDKISPGENLTLYGGEPLDKRNKELIRYIVEKGKEQDYTFFAVTNGHDLDHYMDLIDNDKINSLQITIDGPREIHNCRRIALNKESSYDKIVSNVKSVISNKDVSVLLRINIDKRNITHMLDLLADLDESGILDNPKVTLSANSVIGEDNILLNHNDISKLEKDVEKNYPILNGAFTSFNSSTKKLIWPSLLSGEPVQRSAFACGSASGMKVFTPDGNIYSCWSAIGYPEHVIGRYDISRNVSWNRDVLDAWSKKTVAYDKMCYRCKYLFLCSGGCRRPELPNEAHSNAKECDYYQNMFSEYLAKLTDEYLAAGNE